MGVTSSYRRRSHVEASSLCCYCCLNLLRWAEGVWKEKTCFDGLIMLHEDVVVMKVNP